MTRNDHPFNRRKEKRIDQRQDRDVAAKFGGVVNPASGALPVVGLKGDVRTEKFKISDKATTKKSFRLEYGYLAEIERLAFQDGKVPLLVLRFDFKPKGLLEKRDWAIVPVDDLLDLI